jgi:carboxyvinyl-carboxyphosphonate phosphorylmutase
MALTSFAARRRRFRELLDRPAVAKAASIFDAVSARLAAAAGFECGMFAGTIASQAVLAAPDLVVLTLTELTEQARRISRASDLPFLVDGDHGYGNALNVGRTAEELEAAGAAALFIEDSVLPRRYAGAAGEPVSLAEFEAKIRAAVDARSDAGLMIVGRPTALQRGDFEEALRRSVALKAAGADAIFLIGATSSAQVIEVHETTGLPILLQNPLTDTNDEARCGVRFIVPSHLPFFVAMRALAEAYRHLKEGGTRAHLLEKAMPVDKLGGPLATAAYAQAAMDYCPERRRRGRLDDGHRAAHPQGLGAGATGV